MLSKVKNKKITVGEIKDFAKNGESFTIRNYAKTVLEYIESYCEPLPDHLTIEDVITLIRIQETEAYEKEIGITIKEESK